MKKYWIKVVLGTLLICITGCTKGKIIELPPPSAYQTPGIKTVQVEIGSKLPVQTIVNRAEKESETKSLYNESGFSVHTTAASYNLPQTRSGYEESNKILLSNLWIFQFDTDSVLLYKEQITNIEGKTVRLTDGQSTVIYNGSIINTNLAAKDNQTLYLVALGATSCDFVALAKEKSESVAGIKLADFEKLPIEYINADGTLKVTSPNRVPYSGKVKGVNIKQRKGMGSQGFVEYNVPQGFDGAIPLNYLLVPITCEITNFDMKGINPNTGQSVTAYTLDNMTLYRVPKTTAIVPPATASTNPDDYTDTAPITFTAAGSYTYTWYAAKNNQLPVAEITGEQNRFRYRSAGAAPQCATYINITAKGIIPNKYDAGGIKIEERGTVGNKIFFQVYPGDGDFRNFALQTNNTYKVATAIQTTDPRLIEDDPRVIFFYDGQVEEYFDFSFEKDGVKQLYLDAHYDVRRIKMHIEGSGNDLKIEIVPTTNNSDANWLQISRKPTYSEAKATADLTTGTFKLTGISGDYTFYIYNDEYPWTAATTEKEFRECKIIVTTTAQNGYSKSFEYIARQISPKAIGNFGAYNAATGKYESMLLMDCVDENRFAYRSEDWNKRGSLIEWGFINTPTGQTSKEDGRLSTIFLATGNGGSISSGLGDVTIGGVPLSATADIIASPDHFTFAARYCFDKNRDEDGNGKIEGTEVKWYLPAQNQLMAAFSTSGNNRYTLPDTNYGMFENSSYSTGGVLNSFSYFSSTELNKDKCYPVNFFSGLSRFDNNMAIKTVKSMVRCVRNAGSKITNAVEVKAYGGYAVIDASGLNSGKEKRSDNPSFRSQNRLATNTNAFVAALPYSPANNISERFAVSPTDVASTLAVYSDFWAPFAGWSSSYNSAYVPANPTAAALSESGCYTYQGVSGTDAKGTWRMPTQKELMLIWVLQNDLYSTQPTTGFNKLQNNDLYWSGTESMAGGSDAVYVNFGKDDISYGVLNYGGQVRPISKGSVSRARVRCVKDIDTIIPPTRTR